MNKEELEKWKNEEIVEDSQEEKEEEKEVTSYDNCFFAWLMKKVFDFIKSVVNKLIVSSILTYLVIYTFSSIFNLYVRPGMYFIAIFVIWIMSIFNTFSMIVDAVRPLLFKLRKGGKE